MLQRLGIEVDKFASSAGTLRGLKITQGMSQGFEFFAASGFYSTRGMEVTGR